MNARITTALAITVTLALALGCTAREDDSPRDVGAEEKRQAAERRDDERLAPPTTPTTGAPAPAPALQAEPVGAPPAPATIAEPTAPASEPPPPAVSAAPTPAAADAELVSRVKEKLAFDADAEVRTLVVEANGGAVSLGGSVMSQEQKDRAEQIAKGVAGVIKLDNQVVVTPAS